MSDKITKLPINFDNLLKIGFAVIDVRYYKYDFVDSDYNYVIIKVENDRSGFYKDMLKTFIQEDLPDNNVIDIWNKILIHKLELSKQLRRDINIKVATCDFFSVNQE